MMKKSIDIIPILLVFLGILTIASCSDNGELVEETAYGRIVLNKIGDTENRYAVYANNEIVMDTSDSNEQRPYIGLMEETLLEVRNEETGEVVLDSLLFPENDMEVNLIIFNTSYENKPLFVNPPTGVEPAPEGYENVRLINLTTTEALKGKTIDLVYYVTLDYVNMIEIYRIDNIPADGFTEFVQIPNSQTLGETFGYDPVLIYIPGANAYDSNTGEELVGFDEFGYPGLYTYFQESDFDRFNNISYQIYDFSGFYAASVIEALSTPVE